MPRSACPESQIRMRTFALVGLVIAALSHPPRQPARRCRTRHSPNGSRTSVRNYAKFSIFDDININVDNRNVVLTGRVTVPLKSTKSKSGSRGSTACGRSPTTSASCRLADRPAAPPVVANAIYNHPKFWRYAERAHPPIHIIIEHQRVTLTGVVEKQVDRMLAYSLAQGRACSASRTGCKSVFGDSFRDRPPSRAASSKLRWARRNADVTQTTVTRATSDVPRA